METKAQYCECGCLKLWHRFERLNCVRCYNCKKYKFNKLQETNPESFYPYVVKPMLEQVK